MWRIVTMTTHPWLSPRVPHNPVFSSILCSPASYSHNMVDFRRLHILRIKTTSVCIKFFCGHNSTAEGKRGLMMIAIMKLNYWYKGRVLVHLKPDWTAGVDFCHHVFPSTNGSKVTYFPQGVVLHYIAFPKSCARPTGIERFAFWEEEFNVWTLTLPPQSSVSLHTVLFPVRQCTDEPHDQPSGLRAMLACPLLIKGCPLGFLFASANRTTQANGCSVLAMCTRLSDQRCRASWSLYYRSDSLKSYWVDWDGEHKQTTLSKLVHA